MRKLAPEGQPQRFARHGLNAVETELALPMRGFAGSQPGNAGFEAGKRVANRQLRERHGRLRLFVLHPAHGACRRLRLQRNVGNALVGEQVARCGENLRPRFQRVDQHMCRQRNARGR